MDVQEHPTFEVEIVFSEVDFGQTTLITLPFANLARARDFVERFNIWTDYSQPDYFIARLWTEGRRVQV